MRENICKPYTDKGFCQKYTEFESGDSHPITKSQSCDFENIA